MSPTNDRNPARQHVEVRYSDHALSRLAAHLSRTAPGVARLQPQLSRHFGALASNLLARNGQHDDRAVTISRGPDGTIEISARVVSRLRPAPVEVARALARTITAELGAITGQPVHATVTIVDVEP